LVDPFVGDAIHEPTAPLLEKPERFLEELCKNGRYVIRRL